MATAKLVFPTNEKNDSLPRAKLASFVHGQLKEEKLCFDNCKIYEHKKQHKKQIMVVETDDMAYAGKNFGYDSYENDFQRTFLGAYSPETGKMEIFDVDMFKFKPYIPEIEDDIAKDESEMSIREQVDQLTTAFGSKKRRKFMEERKKNLVKDETLKKVLDSTVKENTHLAVERLKTLEDMVKADESQMFLIPPCNRTTKKVEEIYNLSDIVSDFDLDLLKDPAETLFNAESSTIEQWRTKKKYPLCVLRHLQYLPVKEEDKWHKCKCLMYLHYMIEFFKISDRRIVQLKDPLPPEWPVTTKKRMLEMFTGPQATAPSGDNRGRLEYRTFPKKYQERLLSYTLVLALILDTYSLKISDLMKDMKIGKLRLTQFARMLGCKVTNFKSKDNSLITAELQAPFVITVNKNRSMKKK